MTKQRVLTGITPSGTPHLGNYVGSIRPAIVASNNKDVASYYFLADLHALIKCQDPQRVQRSTLEIAASWLACGLDPDSTFFYRQSDIPQISELFWLLTCSTSKGLLNRAHAYKAVLDKNQQNGLDVDTDVSAGLFMYPVLMAADILMFKANLVPVGRDQIQHIEMARDIANSFNHTYGEYFVLPQYLVDDKVAVLPGLDGRKMSKSYNNTIAIFLPQQQLKKLIFSIVTDSKGVNQAKETKDSAIFQIYQAFASSEETEQMRADFNAGLSWSALKQKLVERIEQEIAPMRDKYYQLISQPQQVEQVLQQGADKLRQPSQEFVKQLKQAVGLRSLTSFSVVKKDTANNHKVSYQFKQYREKDDGLFYFKLVANDGTVLLQSVGFSDPKQVGQIIAQIRQNGSSAIISFADSFTLCNSQQIDFALLA